MNNQPVKRRNPFDRPKPDLVQKNEELKELKEEIKAEEPIIQEPEYVEPVVEKRPRVQTRNSYSNTKASRQRYVQPDNQDRAKYTSTMETSLRRKIKIVCATRGIMFSEFIEEACREKLQREGER